MDINDNSIRERAHWLWKQAGSPEGRDLEFWLEAEQTLHAESGNTPTSDDKEASSTAYSVAPTPFGMQS